MAHTFDMPGLPGTTDSYSTAQEIIIMQSPYYSAAVSYPQIVQPISDFHYLFSYYPL